MTMNQYAAQAMAHWEKYLPEHLASLEDPQEFFTDLGEKAEQEIQDRVEAMRANRPTTSSFLTNVGLANNDLTTVRGEVIRSMILVDPQDSQAIQALLS